MLVYSTAHQDSLCKGEYICTHMIRANWHTCRRTRKESLPQCLLCLYCEACRDNIAPFQSPTVSDRGSELCFLCAFGQMCCRACVCLCVCVCACLCVLVNRLLLRICSMSPEPIPCSVAHLSLTPVASNTYPPIALLPALFEKVCATKRKRSKFQDAIQDRPAILIVRGSLVLTVI